MLLCADKHGDNTMIWNSHNTTTKIYHPPAIQNYTTFDYTSFYWVEFLDYIQNVQIHTHEHTPVHTNKYTVTISSALIQAIFSFINLRPFISIFSVMGNICDESSFVCYEFLMSFFSISFYLQEEKSNCAI